MATKVLVVDDDHSLRRSLVRLLTAQGYEVAEARGAAEAVQAALEARPDVILMDLFMPGRGGVEATRDLKADPRTSRIPVIALTASRASPTHARGLFDLVLTKPCAAADLLAAIGRISGSSAGA